jgi:hypothetical protein
VKALGLIVPEILKIKKLGQALEDNKASTVMASLG